MDVVNIVFYTIRQCADIIGFLLDLNFIIVHSLMRLIVAFFSFVNNFPTLLTNFVVEYWKLTVFCMVDGMAVVAEGAVNMFGRCLHVLGGVLESIKMMGYLSSHVILRTRDLLHRGILSVWDGCGIAVSLALYLANTVVNLLLIATQNVYSVVVSMWEAVSSPLQKALELSFTLLTFLHSSLVGTSLVLWTPCRLALELLGSLAHIFISVFLLNVYGLVLTTTTAVAATLYLNPELTRRGACYAINYVNSVPALRRLRGALLCLHEALHCLPGALHHLYLLERGLWQRLHRQGSLLGLGLMIPGYRANRVGGDGDTGPPEPQGEQRAPPDGMAGREGHFERPGPLAPLPVDPYPSSSTDRPLQKLSSGEGSKGPPADCLLNLLKEQEHRKKCVICHDSNKTVVLLPCRHLCLCRDCTGILLRQPIYLQNCPLCRHMILNTMDVYL